jgi:hypothetical protein
MEVSYLPVGIVHVEVVGCFYGSNVASDLWNVEGREVHNIISQLSIPETLCVHNRDILVV